MSTNIFTAVGSAIKHWYIPLLIGLLMVGVGIWTFANPLESYLGLSFLFGLSFLISGLMDVVFSISNREEIRNWGWNFALGLITTIVGFQLVRDPVLSMTTLPFYVGFVFLFRSISTIGFAYDLKDSGVGDWGNLLAVGVLGLLFSFMLLWFPGFAGMTIVTWTGLVFLFSGIFSIYLALKLNKIRRKGNEIREKLR